MSILIAMIIGLVTGVVAGALMKENYDLLFMNSVLGIAGGLLGLGVYAITASGDESVLFSWTAVTFEVLGALITVGILNLLHRAAPDKKNIVAKGEGK